MGQKVMPTGFRLGITEDWRSRWYSDKDYAKNLANDMEIRKFLDKYLAKAAVAKVEIERAGDKVKVIITTACHWQEGLRDRAAPQRTRQDRWRPGEHRGHRGQAPRARRQPGCPVHR